MEKLIQLNTLRDIEIELVKAQIDGIIIPDEVFAILKKVEDSYRALTS